MVIMPTGTKTHKVTNFLSLPPALFFVSCFSPPQQDNIDRSSNHRQADLIGPAFQPSANQSSPNHQGWSWFHEWVCVCICVCVPVPVQCGEQLASHYSSLVPGGWLGGNGLLYLGLFRCKHLDSSKGDRGGHRVPL